MRLVQVLVPAGKRETVLNVLDSEDVDYAVSEEVSNPKYTAVVWFPLPSEAVEPIFERLYEVGLERDAFTVVVEAETVVSHRFDELQEKYETTERGLSHISREELAAEARDLAPDRWPFFLMTVISAIVATAGLLVDSPAVVVGSMVIAPLVGPAMATSVGSVVNNREMFMRGVKLQAVGTALAIVSATLFAALLRQAHVVPLSAAEVTAIDEVNERVVPDVLSLFIALGAGAAGAISLSSGISAALVGVMIAAALIPPLAVVGIGLAWGDLIAAFGAFVLVLVNVLSINFAALITFWYMGYRPRQWLRVEGARLTTLKRIAVLGVAILVLSSLLGAVTYNTYQRATFEDRVRVTVVEEIDDYDHLQLIDVQVNYEEKFPVSSPSRVILTIGYTPGAEAPGLAVRLSERVNRVVTDPLKVGSPGPVAVEVRYIPFETARARQLRSPTGAGLPRNAADHRLRDAGRNEAGHSPLLEHRAGALGGV